MRFIQRWMPVKPLQNKKDNVTELKSVVNRLYYVSYDSEFLGTIAARTKQEAFNKAISRFGKHIIRNTNYLDVVDSGKYENP